MAANKTRFHVLIDEETAQTALVGFSHMTQDGAPGRIAGVDVSADELERMGHGLLEKAKEMRARQKAIAAKKLVGRS